MTLNANGIPWLGSIPATLATQHGHRVFSRVWLAIRCYHSLERTTLPQNLISCFYYVNTSLNQVLDKKRDSNPFVLENMPCSVFRQ